MLKATDLRIGNLVMDRDNKQLRIDWFEKDKVCMNQMVGNGSVHPLTEYFEYLQPIPLTPEILEKEGFERIDHIHGYTFYTLSKSKKNRCHIDIYPTKTTYLSYPVNHCQYLHQLQNLKHSLTGEELEINL